MLAQSISINELAKLQSSRYVHAVSLTLFIYDYILTLPDEVAHAWTKPLRGFASILFFLNRYPAFIDLFLSFYIQVAFGLTARQDKLFDQVTGGMFFFGIIVSELIMFLRVWVLWGRTRGITLTLAMLAFIGATAGVVAYALSRQTLQYVPLYGINLPGYYPQGGRGIIKVADYITVLAVDFIILLLTIVGCFKRSQLNLSAFLAPMSLIDIFARDGVIYFICLAVVAIANVLVSITDGDTAIGRVHVISLQRCLHSILVSRIFLTLRQKADSERGIYTD